MEQVVRRLPVVKRLIAVSDRTPALIAGETLPAMKAGGSAEWFVAPLANRCASIQKRVAGVPTGFVVQILRGIQAKTAHR